MTRGATILVVAASLVAAGCSLTAPRQTLADLDDGRSVFAQGRREVCLHLESPEDEVVASGCDLVEDPLHLTEYVAFGGDDGAVAVGIAPLDVTTVEVVVDGAPAEEVATIPSDMTTGFYLVELPPGADEVTVRGFDDDGEQVGDPLRVEVPAPGEVTSETAA